MIEFNYAYSVESSYNSNYANPRLDSSHSFANSEASRAANADFWVEIDFAGNSHFVHGVILEKHWAGSFANINYFRIKYQNSGVSGNTWLDYDGGNDINSG